MVTNIDETRMGRRMNDLWYSRVLGAPIFVLTFLPFLYSFIYALWVLVFGDGPLAIYIWPIAIILSSLLSGAALFFYARLIHKGLARAWLATLLSSWAISALIYIAAIVLNATTPL